MKKLLTVLLVIAVMFTFSFSSAFALETEAYKAQTSGNELYTVDAYKLTTGTDNGSYGITEAYRATELAGLKTAKLAAKTVYFANDVEAVKALYDTAMDAVKAAKTCQEALAAKTALATARKAYDLKASESDFKALVSQTNVGIGSKLSTTVAPYYFVPGYGYVSYTDINKDVATLTSLTEITYGQDVIYAWFLGEGYRTAAKAKAAAATLASTYVPCTAEWIASVQKEYDAINAKAQAAKAAYSAEGTYAAYSAGSYTLADLDAIYAEEAAFEAKYVSATNVALFTGTNTMWKAWEVFNSGAASTEKFLAYQYMHQFDAEVTAVDLTDKTAVCALYNKINNLKDDFDYITLAYPTAPAKYGELKDAYDAFKTADETELSTMNTKFKVMSGSAAPYYFDDSAKNVEGLEAARKAYDAYYTNYEAYYNEGLEAQILAAEHNMKAAAGFDAKDDKKATSIVKTYLNNATVTVKTTKLAAKKVRVQAKVDAQTLEQIVKNLDKGFTVEYKFYHKAPGKSFKLTKTKGVNYITYTSKSLKAGKNSFRVGIVIKDADGKVLATKDYQASSLAYRTIK